MEAKGRVRRFFRRSATRLKFLLQRRAGQLHCLNVAKGKIVLLASKTFENEIACLDCTPMGDGMSSPVCAVGLWSMDIVLASMSDLSVITKESTDEDIIPRSTFAVFVRRHSILVRRLR